jgi:hypothetical protein
MLCSAFGSEGSFEIEVCRVNLSLKEVGEEQFLLLLKKSIGV